MKYKVEIASVPDKEQLVVEIWEGDNMVAEVSQDQGRLVLELYVKEGESAVLLDHEHFLSALCLAKERLAPDNGGAIN